MAWPGVSDYQEAVQAPQICFADAELKAGSPVLTKLGLPRPISGGNASVYQIRSGKGEFAVRCFLRDVKDLRERYALIDAHLRTSGLGAKVGFDYLQDGIRIRGQWFPVLKMEWVRGVPLNEHIAAIRTDAAALRRLADDWRGLMRDLEQAKIAHGDLQHGNVMIEKSKLVLIDYDGMFVPALAGKPGMELGHPSYQHPQRTGADFGPDIDRFAALAIHTALLALAERPQLWDVCDNADNILFTREDFTAPESSALFAELLQCKDAALLAEVSALRAACREPIGRVPRLDDVQKGPQRAGVGANGRKPQWLASLMSSEPAPAVPPPPTGATVAFSLSQAWRHAPAVTQRAPVAVGNPVAAGHPRERLAVLSVLAVLVQLAVYLLWGAAVLISLPVTAVAWHVMRSRGGASWTPAYGVGAVLALSVDGRKVAVLGPTGAADVIGVGNGRRHSRLAVDGQALVGIAGIAGNGFATVARDGAVRIHARSGSVLHTSWQARACCFAASADGQQLALGTAGGRTRVLGIDGVERCSFGGHLDAVLAVAIARDQQGLVTGSADQSVRLWSLGTQRCEHVLAGLSSAVLAVAISATGRFVAGGSADGTVAIWDGVTGKLLHSVRLGGGAIHALAFAPDQAELLATAADRSIRCIDAFTGKVLGRVAGHAAPAVAIAISSDGSRVVTADAHGNALAWQRRPRTAPAPEAKLQTARA